MTKRIYISKRVNNKLINIRIYPEQQKGVITKELCNLNLTYVESETLAYELINRLHKYKNKQEFDLRFV
jgi:retron-type reverse transcriptase